MRAIDADALWMDVMRSIDYCDDFLEIIERQPTIERNCEGCRFTFCKELTEAMEDDLK